MRKQSVLAVFFCVILTSVTSAAECQRCGRGCGSSVGYCSLCQRIPYIAAEIKAKKERLKLEKEAEAQQKKRDEQARRELAAAERVIGICEVCKHKIREYERSDSLIIKNPNKNPPKTAKKQKCWCCEHFCNKHRRPYKENNLCDECIAERVRQDKERAERAEEQRLLAEQRKIESEKLALLEGEAAARRNAEETKRLLEDVNPLLTLADYYESRYVFYLSMKTCPIHQWSEGFAPRFGGDYYTEQTRASYFQSKMAAVQAKQTCRCYTPNVKQEWNEMQRKQNVVKMMPSPFNDNPGTREAAEMRVKEVLESKLITLTPEARKKLEGLKRHIGQELAYCALEAEWLADKSQFDK